MKNLFLVFVLSAVLVSTIECRKKVPNAITDPTYQAALDRANQAMQEQIDQANQTIQQQKDQLKQLKEEGKALFAQLAYADYWWNAFSKALQTATPEQRQNTLANIAKYKSMYEQANALIMQNGKQVAQLQALLGIIIGSVRVTRST